MNPNARMAKIGFKVLSKINLVVREAYTANFSVVICTTPSRDRFSDVVQM